MQRAAGATLPRRRAYGSRILSLSSWVGLLVPRRRTSSAGAVRRALAAARVIRDNDTVAGEPFACTLGDGAGELLAGPEPLRHGALEFKRDFAALGVHPARGLSHGSRHAPATAFRSPEGSAHELLELTRDGTAGAHGVALERRGRGDDGQQRGDGCRH